VHVVHVMQSNFLSFLIYIYNYFFYVYNNNAIFFRDRPNENVELTIVKHYYVPVYLGQNKIKKINLETCKKNKVAPRKKKLKILN